jgi:hypothetical protein
MKNPCIFVILSVAALGQGASALQEHSQQPPAVGVVDPKAADGT